jgi:hypothetical protein
LKGEFRFWDLSSYATAFWLWMLGVALTLILLLVRIFGFCFSSEVALSIFINQSFNKSA